MLAAFGLLGEAAVENALQPLPYLDRNKRLVRALDELAVPFELARVEPVAQDSVHGAYGHLRAALGIDEARCLRLLGSFFQRNTTTGVPFEQFDHDGRDSCVDRDYFLAVRANDIAIKPDPQVLDSP